MNKRLSLLSVALLDIACATVQAVPKSASVAAPPVPVAVTAIESASVSERGAVTTLAPAKPPTKDVEAQEWFAGKDTLKYPLLDGWEVSEIKGQGSYTCVSYTQGRLTVEVKLQPAPAGLPSQQCERLAQSHIEGAKAGSMVITQDAATSSRVTWKNGPDAGFVACDSVPKPRAHLVRVVEAKGPASQAKSMAKTAMDISAQVTIE